MSFLLKLIYRHNCKLPCFQSTKDASVEVFENDFIEVFEIASVEVFKDAPEEVFEGASVEVFARNILQFTIWHKLKCDEHGLG